MTTWIYTQETNGMTKVKLCPDCTEWVLPMCSHAAIEFEFTAPEADISRFIQVLLQD